MGKSTISMAMFNSYVSSPEGNGGETVPQSTPFLMVHTYHTTYKNGDDWDGLWLF